MTTSLLAPTWRLASPGRALIDGLLPGTASYELFGDVGEDLMLRQEVDWIGAAAPARRLEFGTVRSCARAALRRIGVGGSAILPDPDGVPQWPDGVVGSLTHCSGYRAATVARSDLIRGIGIDAEPDAPLPTAVADLVRCGPERPHLQQLAARRPDLAWDRLLFCAKEAAFKAWFPLTRRWLEFSDLTVEFDLNGGFTARLPAWSVRLPGSPRTGPSLSALRGRWAVGSGFVVTGCCVPGGTA